MNCAGNGRDCSSDLLTVSRDAAAQLFPLYTLSGGPTRFEKEIHSTRREAIVRFRLHTPGWRANARIVHELERAVAALFPGDGARAVATGTVLVDNLWMQSTRESHFRFGPTVGARRLRGHGLWQRLARLRHIDVRLDCHRAPYRIRDLDARSGASAAG